MLKLGNDVVVREPVAIPLVSERTDVTVVENVLVPLGPMLVVSTVAMLVAAEDVSAVSDDDGPVDVEGNGNGQRRRALGVECVHRRVCGCVDEQPVKSEGNKPHRRPMVKTNEHHRKLKSNKC